MSNSERFLEKMSKKTVGIVSLGCDKNRVDTENMLFFLKSEGFEITNDINKAQVLIVNTCAFISSARQESIDTILELAEYKQKNCQKLIVTGCLPKKHLQELADGLTEVDAFLGTESYQSLPKIINDLFQSDQRVCNLEQTDGININRVLSTPQHYAYLKIAEGCNNRCTYCTIPSIRGNYRSRTIDSLVDEAKLLADQGAKELILVAQDTTRFGCERGQKELLPLLQKLHNIGEIEWIRLMYCYPEMIDDELIDFVSDAPKMAKYLDIPMQHADDEILKRMNRRSTNAGLCALMDKIRTKNPNIAVRSTFMVGFPGETEKHFENLLQFILGYKLDHMGFFAYSKEEGTLSYKFDGQISKAIKKKRLNIIAKAAKEIILQNNRKYIDKTCRVLYEGIDFDKNLFFGRIEQSAPDVDNLVYFRARFADVGNFYDVKIKRVSGYDLIGEQINAK